MHSHGGQYSRRIRTLRVAMSSFSFVVALASILFSFSTSIVVIPKVSAISSRLICLLTLHVIRYAFMLRATTSLTLALPIQFETGLLT